MISSVSSSILTTIMLPHNQTGHMLYDAKDFGGLVAQEQNETQTTIALVASFDRAQGN